jgi:hypothetical protein
MGPSLCVLMSRAAEAAGVVLDVLAVSSVSDPAAHRWL